MRKLYVAITLALLASIFTFHANAQRGVPMSLQPDYNRMMANQWQQQMSMNQRMNQRWYFGFDGLVNNKYTFAVTMKDSSVRDVKSKIYADTVLHKSYLLYVNKDLARDNPARETKIYSDQTVKISRKQGMFEGAGSVDGVATDSCWLFKIITGKISVYSHLSEIMNVNGAYMRAFQLGDGPVQRLDSAALAPVIKTNPKALKAFIKKDYYKAINKYDGY